MLNSKKEALDFLNGLGASEHLKTHVELVGEAADLIIEKLEELGIQLDFEFIRVAVAIHDVGKIIHTGELTGPGSEHEPEGEKILIENGVSPRLARVSMSHARWYEMECSFEEFVVALSDSLWKGTRMEKLELEVVDRAAHSLHLERWDIFVDLDLRFEEIALLGHERLRRSVG